MYDHPHFPRLQLVMFTSMQLKEIVPCKTRFSNNCPQNGNTFNKHSLHRKPKLIATKFIAFSCLFTFLLSGCATTSVPMLGIRPNHADLTPGPNAVTWCNSISTAKRDCELYRSYHEFAENLSASYRSRATLNEWGLYFAGLVAWSGLTASAGLAADKRRHSSTQNCSIGFGIRLWTYGSWRQQRQSARLYNSG